MTDAAPPSLHDRALLPIAATLALVVTALLVQRAGPASPVIELDRAAWRCTANHVERVPVQQAGSGVGWRKDRVCDAWGRL